MAQCRLFYTLVLALSFVCISAVLTGCSSSSSNPVSGGSIDPLLLGVWWSSTSSEGLEVTSDGTSYQLTSYGGKVARDTAYNKSATQKITSASGGSGKILITTRDTSFTNSFTYVLSNGNSTLTVTTAEGPTIYAKSSIGADAVTSPVGGANTVSITLNGTTYSFTNVTSVLSTDTLYISGVLPPSTYCTILVRNLVSTQTAGRIFPGIEIVIGTTDYISISGNITVTAISGKTTQGTLSVTLLNTDNPSDLPTATGSFNVTHF